MSTSGGVAAKGGKQHKRSAENNDDVPWQKEFLGLMKEQHHDIMGLSVGAVGSNDAEEAFGHSIALTLKNMRPGKRELAKLKLQGTEIMSLLYMHINWEH